MFKQQINAYAHYLCVSELKSDVLDRLLNLILLTKIIP